MHQKPKDKKGMFNDMTINLVHQALPFIVYNWIKCKKLESGIILPTCT
jgi:hypothetical protein